MPRYWMMRVDHWNAGALLWTELQAGRLRQGWGYRADQDLVVLETKKKSGVALTEHQTRTWRGNRRMLPSQTDGIAQGDVIMDEHYPCESSR